MFSEPDKSYYGRVYTERFGKSAYLARMRSVDQRTMGAVLSPLSAFMRLQGIETVALRVDRHAKNARQVAKFLAADRRVAWVKYAGFPESPYLALAQKYLGGRPPSLLTFGLRVGFDTGRRFYHGLNLVKRLVNIGHVKSLACHPASTDAQADVARRVGAGWRHAGDDPALHRKSIPMTSSPTWARRSGPRSDRDWRRRHDDGPGGRIGRSPSRRWRMPQAAGRWRSVAASHCWGPMRLCKDRVDEDRPGVRVAGRTCEPRHLERDEAAERKSDKHVGAADGARQRERARCQAFHCGGSVIVS